MEEQGQTASLRNSLVQLGGYLTKNDKERCHDHRSYRQRRELCNYESNIFITNLCGGCSGPPMLQAAF